MNILPFIKEVEKQCQDNDIKFKLLAKDKVSGSNGYFDGKTLSVAIDNDLESWLGVLVHESCHLDQHLEKIPLYTNVKTHIDEWLSNTKKHEKTLIKIRDLELDCERRGLKKISEWKLPLDKKTYAKKAGAYIHYYNYMLLNPKWFKIPPSHIPEIWVIMPTTLRGKYDKLGKYEDVYRKFYD